MKRFSIDGYNLNYKDEGQGDVLFIVHGTPTNSEEYSELIALLSSQFRCIAIDHLGFGQSDKPHTANYSISAHQQRLEAFIKFLNIDSLHLLVHDFGGVIGLPLITSTNLKVKSVTILNSWLWPLVESEPQIHKQKWLVSRGILPFFYRHLNFSARILIKLGWGKKAHLSKERHQFYINHFKTPLEREGTISFLMTLFDFKSPVWQQDSTLETLKKIPTQILWGLADRLLTKSTLNHWKTVLPSMPVIELEDVGHFVAEEDAPTVAQYISRLANSTK